MIVLLHSSKTMRKLAPDPKINMQRPALLDKSVELNTYLKTLTINELAKTMHISLSLAEKTHVQIANWSTKPKDQTLALHSFVGDIYRGLRASELSSSEQDYANKVLLIISGLYGCIKPYDGISPYRLELGYKLPSPKFSNLYKFWGESIADCLPKKGAIVNLTSVEYGRAVVPYIEQQRLITPEFLSVDSKTNQPTFVAVHAKVARGAFARWLIKTQYQNIDELKMFNDLGYKYSEILSTKSKPTFVCKSFGGLGLKAF